LSQEIHFLGNRGKIRRFVSQPGKEVERRCPPPEDAVFKPLFVFMIDSGLLYEVAKNKELYKL
jgi:hypothetical protein